VLPGDVTPGDAVVLFPVAAIANGDTVETVTSAIGEFLAVFEQQTHPSPFGFVWQCTPASGSFDQATATTSAGGWDAAALEFGPNAGFGQASAGYASFSDGTNYQPGNSSTSASATIENVTAGAAYVVVAYDRSGGAIQSVPGSPWTGLTNLLNVTGLGVAWLIAPNTDSIPVAFGAIEEDNWTLVLVEVLPVAGPPPYAGPYSLSVALSQAVATVSLSAG